MVTVLCRKTSLTGRWRATVPDALASVSTPKPFVFNALPPDSDQAAGDPGSLLLLSDDDSRFLLSVFFRWSEDSTKIARCTSSTKSSSWSLAGQSTKLEQIALSHCSWQIAISFLVQNEFVYVSGRVTQQHVCVCRHESFEFVKVA